jgi:hypothetical protein
VCVDGACKTYKPALGCTSGTCDCATVLGVSGTSCAPLPGQTNRICVLGSACPGSIGP